MVELLVPVITRKGIARFINDTYLASMNRLPSLTEIYRDLAIFRISFGVSHNSIRDRFVLNLNVIRETNKSDRDFIKAVAMTINHEVLHHIICETDSIDASTRYDRVFFKYREEGYSWM